LCDFGHECIHAGEVGMSKATDEEILGFEFAKTAVVVQHRAR